MAVNPHAEITHKILGELKAGTVPWLKPWRETEEAAPVGMPRNAATGRAYRGCNVFMLWLHTSFRPDWLDPAFLTYKQARDAGGHVRKGEKGLPVYYFGETRVDDDAGDDDEGRTIRFLKRYTVFHVSQCDDILPDKLSEQITSVEPLIGDDMRELYTLLGANTLHGGNDAAYLPQSDLIQLPKLEQFDSEAHYHATRLHEIVHWTGAPNRLARDPAARFRSPAYAFEELVAELGAALLCAELGIEGQLRHAEYLANWIKLLDDHDRAFFAAASAAQKAVDFIRERILTTHVENQAA